MLRLCGAILATAGAAHAAPLLVSSGVETIGPGSVYDYAVVSSDAELTVAGGELLASTGAEIPIPCLGPTPAATLTAIDTALLRLEAPTAGLSSVSVLAADHAEVEIDGGEAGLVDLTCDSSLHLLSGEIDGIARLDANASMTCSGGTVFEIQAWGDDCSVRIEGDADVFAVTAGPARAEVDFVGGSVLTVSLRGETTIADNASIGVFALRDIGNLNATGGEVRDSVVVQDDAAAQFDGAIIGTELDIADYALFLFGNAEATLATGEILGATEVNDGATLRVEGGAVGRIDLLDNANADITGGILRNDEPVIASLTNDAALEISGGDVQGADRRFELAGDATLAVTAQSLSVDLGCAPERRIRPGSDLLEPTPDGPTLAGLVADWTGSGSAAFDIQTTNAWSGEIILRTTTASAGPLSIGAGSATVGPADVFDIAFASGNAAIEIIGGAIVGALPLGPIGDDIQDVSVAATDTAQISLSCGSIARRVAATDNARLDITGGDFEAIYLEDSALATISGGDAVAPIPEGRFDLAGASTLRVTAFDVAVDDDFNPATPPTPLGVVEGSPAIITAASPFLVPFEGGARRAIPELFITWPDATTTSLSAVVDAAWTGEIRLFATSPDFNGDGVTGPADLAALIGAWGTPNADFNGDGVTGAADLALLIGAWD